MPTNESVSSAEAFYRDLVALRQQDLTNKELLEHQVHGAGHLISLYARSGAFDKAQSLFDEIGGVVSGNPDQENLREMRAAVAVALASAHGDAGFMDKVQGIYNDVKKTAEEFPNQPDLRDSQARIAFNMAVDYIKQNQMDAVIEICDELKELGHAHPDEDNIDRERVRILANVVFYYTDDDTANLNKARETYNAIVEVSQRRPDDPYIRKVQADTAVSILAKIDDLDE
jgi:hypothetical protein